MGTPLVISSTFTRASREGTPIGGQAAAGLAAAKSVLIIATAFAPKNAIGSVRLSKLTKYLVRQGHQVTVISPVLDWDTRLDRSLECPEFSMIRRHVVPQSHWFERLLARRRRTFLVGKSGAGVLAPRSDSRQGLPRLRAWALRYGHFAYTVLRNHDWKRQVLRYARSALRGEQFDVIISSYPSLGAMWVAGHMRREGNAPKWIADFRDRVNNRVNSPRVIYWLNTFIQNRILKGADHVLGVSDGLVSRLSARYSSKYVVLSNGFDSDDLLLVETAPPAEPEHRIVTLCYTGSLYGGLQDVSIVFSALKRLVDGGALSAEQLEFVYAGKEFGALYEQARREGIESILVDRGYVTRPEALRIQRQADLVVVATWNTVDDLGIMTGKLFECFLMRKPVVGVVNGDRDESEFRKVLERVNGGIVYESASPTREADFDRLCGFLRERIHQRLEIGTFPDTYNSAVDEYAYTSLAKQLSGLF